MSVMSFPPALTHLLYLFFLHTTCVCRQVLIAVAHVTQQPSTWHAALRSMDGPASEIAIGREFKRASGFSWMSAGGGAAVHLSTPATDMRVRHK